ncbi:MAG: sugar nucleotide-binding protein, partial [Aliifodinibius sp.]|nr:sugar nucleotide-binding protein [Fodinibius sp.]NIV14958.1 sugar nucleotide-binding protein [Fodinibius sp.]NIY25927.1 sugar nucleotide-binding protein [Fodinibius sp.]
TAQIDFNNPNWHAVEEFQPEVIIHSAALASIDDCEKNPEIARTVNYTSTTQLIDLAMQMNARFLFVSTDQIYGGNEGNYSEKDSPQPLN